MMEDVDGEETTADVIKGITITAKFYYVHTINLARCVPFTFSFFFFFNF